MMKCSKRDTFANRNTQKEDQNPVVARTLGNSSTRMTHVMGKTETLRRLTSSEITLIHEAWKEVFSGFEGKGCAGGTNSIP